MWNPSRRQFLSASARGLAALVLPAAETEKKCIGLVTSSHSKLAKPSSIEDPLDYQRVRDIVRKAIEYGRPRAGSLEAPVALQFGTVSMCAYDQSLIRAC